VPATFICQQYRAEGRAGVGGLFLYTNTPDDPTNWKPWCLVFPISSRSSQVSGWLDDCSMSAPQLWTCQPAAGSRDVLMSSLALERLRKIIRNQFKAFILFYNSNVNGSCTLMIQRFTTFRNVFQNTNII